MNASRGQSKWAAIQRADLIAEWKFAARIAARDAVNRKIIPEHLPYAIVAVELPVRSLKTRRDAHNYYPTVKAIIDGLVQANVFEDDDVTHLATKEPVFRARSESPNVRVWIWLQ
jgi:hypothetical protein